MSKFYKLAGKETVPSTLMDWAMSVQNKESKQVGKTEFVGGVLVSTVFLGFDHGWGDELPCLFETMVFGGQHDMYQERYSTFDEAEEGHKRVEKMVRESL